MEPGSRGADGLGGRLGRMVQNLIDSGPMLREASSSGNLRVLAQLLGPAFRGLVAQRAKGAGAAVIVCEVDPVAALEVLTLISALREKGVTIFLTTHRLDEAVEGLEPHAQVF